ncbi:alpha/beta hydrolase [Erythrobacter sp. KY5]|uniref:alpha/beta hydrolase n=1 Tax=Erythrobacter sp. KY5 TaxID=2011159 RepID=UPI0018F86C59|nr:alpha/beta hydrolase [Erythrobacter sp. KY5]
MFKSLKSFALSASAVALAAGAVPASTTGAFAMTADNAIATPTQNAAYTTERVTFQSNGEMIVGTLYVPEGVNASNTVKAVVVTGAWTTIKEQMPALYAQRLAENGMVALAFDFRTWGESAGSTRSLENSEMKIADIEAAGRYLLSRREVLEVHGLGICASSGYMATAAERTDIFTSLALVAPWLHNAEIVDAVYGGEEGVAGLIATGREAMTSERATGEPQLITAAGPSGSDALMAIEGYYIDPDRGLVPEWENTFNLASWEGWLTFDGVRAAEGITEPTLVVHSDAAAIPDGARAFYDQLRAPKAQVWLDNVTQFDFYDQPKGVDPAIEAVTAHFLRS